MVLMDRSTTQFYDTYILMVVEKQYCIVKTQIHSTAHAILFTSHSTDSRQLHFP